LREILRTMSARVVEEASVAIPLLGSGLSAAGMVETPAVARAIAGALAALQAGVRSTGASGAEFPL
jgi:chromate reductase